MRYYCLMRRKMCLCWHKKSKIPVRWRHQLISYFLIFFSNCEISRFFFWILFSNIFLFSNDFLTKRVYQPKSNITPMLGYKICSWNESFSHEVFAQFINRTIFIKNEFQKLINNITELLFSFYCLEFEDCIKRFKMFYR